MSDSDTKEELVTPSPTKAQPKRSRTEQSGTSTTPGSPTKKNWKKPKTAKEAMVDTGSEKKGLLRYFYRETEEERERRMRRESAESDLRRQNVADAAILKTRHEAAAKEIERFEAKMRKRKSRSKTYDRERAAGLRDKEMRLKRQRVSQGLDYESIKTYDIPAGCPR